MMDASTPGDRIRNARKRRGLTQKELAAGAGVSLSWVKKIEQGDAGGVRMETFHRLATALRVPTSSLAAGPDAAPAEQADIAMWEPVRRALGGLHPGPQPEEEPTLAGMEAAFAGVVPLLTGNRFGEVGMMLPGLLRDADLLVGLMADEEQAGARRLRSQVRQVTALVFAHTWQFDAAGEAIELARDDASDGLVEMSAVDEQCWGLIRAGRLAETRELAARWADSAEPKVKAGRAEMAAWGRFLLRVSTAAARDNRPGEAADALRYAKVAAQAAGADFRPAASPWQVFGPATVAVIEAENAAVQGRPERVLTIGERLRPGMFPVSRHYHRHRLDVAAAHSALRQYAEAVAVLRDIQADAPEWLVQQRYARDILARIVDRRRKLTPEMADLAAAVRMPL